MPREPKQLFHHLKRIPRHASLPPIDPRAANICLYYDIERQHLYPYGEARMGYIDWEEDLETAIRQPYPEIATYLYPATRAWATPVKTLTGAKPPDDPTPMPFAVYPAFPRSVISKYIADRFHLHLIPIGHGGIIPPHCRIPFNKLFYDATIPIPAQFLTSAHLEMNCSGRINPAPYPGRRHFQFLVLDDDWVPNRLAIIGRDILNHLLLVYRGHANRNALPGVKTRGRLYFGYDNGEPEHEK